MYADISCLLDKFTESLKEHIGAAGVNINEYSASSLSVLQKSTLRMGSPARYIVG